MASGIYDYCEKYKGCVRKIRIVVYQRRMVEDFKKSFAKKDNIAPAISLRPSFSTSSLPRSTTTQTQSATATSTSSTKQKPTSTWFGSIFRRAFGAKEESLTFEDDKMVVSSDSDEGEEFSASFPDFKEAEEASFSAQDRTSLESRTQASDGDGISHDVAKQMETCVDFAIFFFSTDKHSGADAIAAIDRVCQEICLTVTLDSESDSQFISRLTTNQIADFKQLEQNLGVSVNITKDKPGIKNCIIIRGQNDKNVEALKVIRSTFALTERSTAEEMLHDKVKWQFENGPKTFKDYSRSLNLEIEKACEIEKKISEKFKEENGEFVIDFSALVEIRRTKQGIVRRNVRRYTPSEHMLPKTWTKMNEGEKSKSVALKITDAEYTDVYNEFKSSLENPTYTVQLDKVIEICRIQNPRLYQTIETHRRHMTNPMEQKLWHGTSEDTVQHVNENGFNRAYAGKNATFYGRGTYFAKEAGYSNGYAQPDGNGISHMYICRVLTGDYTKGHRSLIDVPAKDPAKPTIKYDSVVNDEVNPTMWVIFSDTQAYPEYLIKYKAK